MCAADDFDAPHVVRFPLTSGWLWDELVGLVIEKSQLPKIVGGKATWALSSKIPLAVCAQEWTDPQMCFSLGPEREAVDWGGEELRLHWTYFAQLDPELVLATLSRLTLRAIRSRR